MSPFLILCTLTIAVVEASPFPQKNPIVEGLRALFGGGRSIEGGRLNLGLFEDLSIPESLIPDEFKFIRTGLCGSDRTKKCFCEDNAVIKSIEFPQSGDKITFKGIKNLFAKCRPV